MCGLSGIVTKVPRSFDFGTFCTLGIANDTRGGDSCGVFIDGKYEYGVGNKALFTNYFQNSDLLYNTEKSSIALLHCRKASVGKINEQTAQPIVIKEGNEVKFVVMHNGTIYNYKELAKKYIPDISITEMTDSQVMARIFYYKGYDVLSEYNGTAVFIIVDYRKESPEVYLFRGGSKEYTHSNEIQAERPLYYCIDKDYQELVFSSIYPYLMALRSYTDTFQVPINSLVKFTGKELVCVKKIDRSKCIQTKVRTTYSNYYVDYNMYYSNWIVVDTTKNLFGKNGEKLHGSFCISDYGRIIKNGTEIYFYQGVPLLNRNCFRFLNYLVKSLHISEKEFIVKYENLIRFLSLDKIYFKEGKWVKAISPTENVIFTGDYNPITTMQCIHICNGVRVSTTYSNKTPKITDMLKGLDINFKSIKAICKSLMNSQEN